MRQATSFPDGMTATLKGNIERLHERAAAERAALDLHINLLTDLVARIADRLEVSHDDPGFEEIRQDVQPERVLDELDRKPG